MIMDYIELDKFIITVIISKFVDFGYEFYI